MSISICERVAAFIKAYAEKVVFALAPDPTEALEQCELEVAAHARMVDGLDMVMAKARHERNLGLYLAAAGHYLSERAKLDEAVAEKDAMLDMTARWRELAAAKENLAEIVREAGLHVYHR